MHSFLLLNTQLLPFELLILKLDNNFISQLFVVSMDGGRWAPDPESL